MLIPLARLGLRALPDPAAYGVTRYLAARPQRPEVTAAQRDALARAKKLYYGDGNVAWHWGDGPPVVLVHGWNGRAAQLAPLAARIAQLGLRAVAMDVTGHGESPGNRAEWAHFLRDIPALARKLGESVYAFVGHSAGALTLMAARYAGRVRAERYVLICAPTHPFPAINAIRRKLSPREGVVRRYREYVGRQFGIPWDALGEGLVYRGDGGGILLCYDTTDRVVNHSEGDRIAALAPGARLVKTSGHGHAALVSAPEVMEEIVGFLRAEG